MAAEQIEQPLYREARVQHRQAAGAGDIEDCTGPVPFLDREHPARRLVECFVPADAFEPAFPAFAHPPQRVEESVRVIEAVEHPKAAGTGFERWVLGLPGPVVGRELYHAAIDNVGLHQTAPAAIVGTGRGHNAFRGHAASVHLGATDNNELKASALVAQHSRVLTFEWDQQKADRNLRKHRVSFREAANAFADPNALVFLDTGHAQQEERLFLLGESLPGRVLIIVFTERSADRIRIISARLATARERESYAG